MNPISELARDLLDTDRLPTAMRERALIASAPFTPDHRSVLSPNFATDLGVRASKDPEAYLSAVGKAVGVNVERYASRASRESMLQSIRRGRAAWGAAESHLDCLINFAGQWKTAGEVASVLIQEPESHGGGAVTYAASALSAIGDPRAGGAFDLAARHARGPFQWSMAQIRKAAWLVKRAHDLDAGDRALDARANGIEALAVQRELTRGDGDVMLGVGENLRGLIWTKRAEPRRAREALELAAEMLRAGGLLRVGEDERNRYLAQANVNLVQLEAMAGQLGSALRRAREHMDWARADDRGSGTESMILCAYMAYQAGALAEALDLARQAEKIVCRIGAVTQVKSTRKLLIAIHHERGESERALSVYESLVSDPVGLQAWIDGEDW